MAHRLNVWRNPNNPRGGLITNAYVTIVGGEDYRNGSYRVDFGAFRSRAHSKDPRVEPFGVESVLFTGADYLAMTGRNGDDPAVQPTRLLTKDSSVAKPGRQFANTWLSLNHPILKTSEEV